MYKNLYIFEDSSYDKLFPLTYLRPVYELRCGIMLLREKISHAFPDYTHNLLCRSELAEVLQERLAEIPVNKNSGSGICINGGILPNDELLRILSESEDERIFFHGDRVVAARLSEYSIQIILDKYKGLIDLTTFPEIPRQEVSVELLTFPWDFLRKNASELNNDFGILTGNKGNLNNCGHFTGVHSVHASKIFLGKNVDLRPGVVLDATKGPIYIDDNVTILPNACILGPCFIGKGCTIKMGAKIYENNSFGPVCKVGGEVENSIILSYSNKQHDGFLGHAYLAEWINLGADTNNSDLKNNYSPVSAVINGVTYQTGEQFLGLIMGDHSKAAINTMFNTGTVAGVSANVFGAGFPNKVIPSFSWGGSDSVVPYDIEKAIAVARTVMARRNVTLSTAEEKLLRDVQQQTKLEWED